MPTEIGSVVQATVTLTRPFGVFLTVGGSDVFVHLPETAWFVAQDHRLPTERFRVGEVVDVLLCGYDHQKRQYFGSIRRARPSEDPYSAFVPDAPELPGIIVEDCGAFWQVQFANGIVGSLVKAKNATELRVGQHVTVRPRAFVRHVKDDLSVDLVASPVPSEKNGVALTGVAETVGLNGGNS